jgi:hypothetical protein
MKKHRSLAGRKATERPSTGLISRSLEAAAYSAAHSAVNRAIPSALHSTELSCSLSCTLCFWRDPAGGGNQSSPMLLLVTSHMCGF